jgi:hypothetical protein
LFPLHDTLAYDVSGYDADGNISAFEADAMASMVMLLRDAKLRGSMCDFTKLPR